VAIRDLLCSCPLCGHTAGIRRAGRAERCTGCNARFLRGGGARIVAVTPDGRRFVRPAADWLDLAGIAEPPPDGCLGPERVSIRIAEGLAPIRAHGELLGWSERFGPSRHGTLTLTPDALEFRGDQPQVDVWRLAELTAVQPSSSSLQIKARGRPVAAVRFNDGSVRLWEERIKHAIRILHRAAGRGEIVEFHPRITS
jgi:hypothetical protein